RMATLAEIAPLATCPAANRLADLIVEDTTDPGAQPDAAFCESTTASAALDRVTPRRVRRFASIALALAQRPATGPPGQPSWRAASFRPLPSRSHRTTTARYLSGRRLSSWSRIGCRSGQGSLSVTAGSGMEVTCLSRTFFLAAVLAAWSAA